MAKEYNNRRSHRSRNSAPRQFLVIAVTFILGYVAASFFDAEVISQWVNAQVLAHHEMKKEPVKPQAHAAIPPKPKFEFYTLLANEKTPGSQSSTNATAGTHAASVASNNTNANVNSNAHASLTSATPSTPVSASTVKTTANCSWEHNKAKRYTTN
jgi:cell division protein FtsN